MKKSFLKIKDFANLTNIRKKINNAFSEKGQEAAEALRALIDELETSEVEFDEKAFAEAVNELIKSYGEVPVAVADAIASKLKLVQDNVKPSEKITAKIKNEISAAILRATSKQEVENAVNGILVKNEISGLSFEDVVDYSIVTGWENLNQLFGQLSKTFYTKFFYTDDEMATADALAKQWDKTSVYDKTIQEIAATGKAITTKYVYKRQRAAFEDLDEIEKAGEMSNFMRWLNEELDRMIVNTLVMAMLVGDTINAVGSRVTTFETIGTKAATDVFTYVANPAVALTVTVEDVRAMCDKVLNPNGKKKVLIMSQTLLTALSESLYAAGGTTFYKSKEEMAGQFGVDEIYITDILSANASETVHAICMLPQGYWYTEKKALSVSYPTYEKNVQNYQKERNIGGAIHDLFSTAVLKEAPVAP